MLILERKPNNAKILNSFDPEIFPDRLSKVLPPERQPLVFSLDQKDELLKTYGVKNILKYRGHLYVAHKDAIGQYVGLKRNLNHLPIPYCYQTKEDADASIKFLLVPL
jgi:hypothetical protein